MSFILRSQRLLLPQGIAAGSLLIRNGTIESVLPHDATVDGIPELDAGEAVVLPGVVDTHVHLNEPGRTAWEGIETASRAAAAGGITTLVDMPLNSSPVTTTLSAFKTKLESAEKRAWVDLAFWGGVVPGNENELAPMAAAGIRGFKCFLTHSGIDDFPNVTEQDLRRAMPILAEAGVPLLVHAELEVSHPDLTGLDPRHYSTFLASRPSEWEVAAVRLMIRLVRETGCPVHIVHLASADALADIAAAKAEGLPITAETCPHYLYFAAEDIPDGATEYKCAPPIRGAENRERLWQGLADGVLDFVACDHSPCTPDLKLPEQGDFMGAWGGIAGLQFSLSTVWSAARPRGFSLEEVVRWLTERTARFAGFEQKGALAPGKQADFTLFHPDEAFTVEASGILHRHPTTPYLGRRLEGVVSATYLRGEKIFDRGRFLEAPTGRLLLAPRGKTPQEIS